MKTAKKSAIEAIFPLNYMQQGFLFHYLTSEMDEGFLNVEFVLKGTLDESIFQAALNSAARRHAVLRTTVHWVDLEKPVSLVHNEKPIQLYVQDWKSFSQEEQNKKWKALKTKCQKTGVDFEKGPLSKVFLAILSEDDFKLLWPSHHLVIDGWSSQIVMRDVLTFYNTQLKRESPQLETLPPIKSFWGWSRNYDKTAFSEYWSNHFNGFTETALFDLGAIKTQNTPKEVRKLILSSDVSNALKSLARQWQLTSNTLVQGAWSFLAGRFLGVDDVVYGTTVSGRSGDFPNLSLLAGMFMNVHPIRSQIDSEQSLQNWFQDFQKSLQRSRQFEHVGLDEITSIIDWPEARPLFDSLLVFENYPAKDTQKGPLQMVDFKSGITSTYPLTLTVLPVEEIEFVFSFDTSVFNESAISWILEHWMVLLEELAKEPASFSELTDKIPVSGLFTGHLRNEGKKDLGTSIGYVAPSNDIELTLVKIWEKMFGMPEIGVQDNFFQLGGKSLMAARLFSMINMQLDVKLSPTLLLQNPTIATIALAIEEYRGEGAITSYENLVPLRTQGNKPALFCLHAGGGHVFFYNPLAQHLEKGRPVYALQPSGIYDEEKMHSSIIEMAQAYANEIRQVQPEGPYNLLAYCFSTALGLEISAELKKQGHMTNLIVMDTMAEQENLMTTSRMTMRILGFLKRLGKNPVKVIAIMVSDRYNRYLKPIVLRLKRSKEELSTALVGANLIKLYNQYEWQSKKEKIKLVLTEKPNERFNKEYIRSWRTIALGGVEIIETEGDHRTLFLEPDVEKVAHTINQILL